MLTAAAPLPARIAYTPLRAQNVRRTWLPLAVIVALATLVRIPGLFTDFWGDEIWSWSIAGKLHSIADILLADPARIDNNHPLNTLWLYLLGAHQPIWLYRLPALLFGAASIPLAARIMARRGRTSAIITALLIGFSYPAVLYSSEARGYAAVVFFAFLALDAMELACDQLTNVSARWLFGIACALGFLSHLTFLHVYLAAVVASAIGTVQRVDTTRERVRQMVLLHALPLAAAMVLYRLFIVHIVIGGAAATVPYQVIQQALSLTAGGGSAGIVACLSAVAIILLYIGGVVVLSLRSDRLAVFSLVATVLSPLVICGQELLRSPHPQPLMVRYFLVCLAIGLLPVASALAHLWQAHRLYVCGVLALFIVGSACEIGQFIRLGRGHYQLALARISEASTGSTVRIASDNPVRTGMILEFYGPQIFADRVVIVGASPAKWLVLNRAYNVADTRTDYHGQRYVLVDVYPYADLSGWAWHVYKEESGNPGQQ